MRGDAPGVRTRLAGRRALVVGGEHGAELFYDRSRLSRAGAIPLPTARTLFGRGAVHGLDGVAHDVRKALFVSLLTPEAVADVRDRAGRAWEAAIEQWTPGRPVALQPQAAVVLAEAVLGWAGVPTTAAQLPVRARDLWQVVDGFGSFGPRLVAAYRARRRSERWLGEAVRAARADPASAAPVLRALLEHRDSDGTRLDDHTAVVELHNLVRPTVAVSWFVTYSALTLAGDPELRERLARGEPADTEAFAHELRRLHPFVPVLAATADLDFTWQGHQVRRGDLVVLDVFGSHHDPASWPDPAAYRHERFLGREPGPFELLAQGGGDARTGHRCPGERLAVELVKDAGHRLAAARWSLQPASTAASTAASRGWSQPSLRRMPPRVVDVRIVPG